MLMHVGKKKSFMNANIPTHKIVINYDASAKERRTIKIICSARRYVIVRKIAIKLVINKEVIKRTHFTQSALAMNSVIIQNA